MFKNSVFCEISEKGFGKFAKSAKKLIYFVGGFNFCSSFLFVGGFNLFVVVCKILPRFKI